MEKPWFKVLVNGRSCHNWDLAWSLPKQEGDTWVPGDWHEVVGTLAICVSGLHVTQNPAAWWLQGCDVYLCEPEGIETEQEDKAVARRVRLLRPASAAELIAACIYSDGQHRIASGRAVASGSATVRAWGSATVRAWDSATVRASGSATVEAWDSATVRAWDSATVTEVYGQPKVDVKDYAVAIDRRNGAPVIRTAKTEGA